jgi:hypothetical protein
MSCIFLQINASTLTILKNCKFYDNLSVNESSEDGYVIIGTKGKYCSCGIYSNKSLNDLGKSIISFLDHNNINYEIIDN